MTMCRNCNPGEACYIPEEYYIYQVEEYGFVAGEEAMMNEIY
jgi:cathepsin X